MTTDQEKAYRGLAIATAPFRWLQSLFNLLLLGVFFVAIGCFYPLILWGAGEPVTLLSFSVPPITILMLLCLLYAPLFFILVGAAIFGAMCAGWEYAPHSTYVLFNSGWGYVVVLGAATMLGIYQRFRYLKRDHEQRMQEYQRKNHELYEWALDTDRMWETKLADMPEGKEKWKYIAMGMDEPLAAKALYEAQQEQRKHEEYWWLRAKA